MTPEDKVVSREPWWLLTTIYSSWAILAVGVCALIAVLIRHDYKTFKDDLNKKKEHIQ